MLDRLRPAPYCSLGFCVIPAWRLDAGRDGNRRMGDSPGREEGEISSLDDLDSRLKRARGAPSADPGPAMPRSGLAMALRLAAEMVSALIVGGAIGWFLDRWLDTGPWLLLLFLLLGAVAGTLNAYRAAMRISAEDEARSSGD